MGTCRLDDICKDFGGIKACDHVSFEVKDKEFKFLLGPSGAGKTTTLRIIAGLEQPDSGRVYIDGKDVTDYPPEERPVAMIFQQAALYPHMTVRGNLEFPLKVNGIKKEARAKRVREIAELVKIDHRLDHSVTTLSGGEKQRVALGRLFVQDASIYLMDEALTWLDAKLRMLMRTEIKMLQDELGITVVFVTHDQSEALSMGSSIVLMNNGVIQQAGDPYEIYNRPVNTWVADFIGAPSMNFLAGTIDSDLRLDCGVARLAFSAANEARIKEHHLVGRKVLVGFRPEDTEVYRGRENGGGLECTVKAVEFEGYRTIVDLAYSDGMIIRASISSQQSVPKKGEVVWSKWSSNTEILFDADGGKRLF